MKRSRKCESAGCVKFVGPLQHSEGSKPRRWADFIFSSELAQPTPLVGSWVHFRLARPTLLAGAWVRRIFACCRIQHIANKSLQTLDVIDFSVPENGRLFRGNIKNVPVYRSRCPNRNCANSCVTLKIERMPSLWCSRSEIFKRKCGLKAALHFLYQLTDFNICHLVIRNNMPGT